MNLSADLQRIVGDVPRALLDIYGKPLVQRQAEAFAQQGIHDYTLVADIDASRIPIPNMKLVRHHGSSMLSSIRAGMESIGKSNDVTLICYSDILFQPRVLETILGCSDPIVILVDRLSDVAARHKKKSLEYVVCNDPAPQLAGGPDAGNHYAVRKIGKDIPREDSHFEFIGLVSLSPKGFDIIGETIQGRTRTGADNDLSLVDLLQMAVDDGHSVTAVEQQKGWMEIHDFEDYRQASQEMSRRNP